MHEVERPVLERIASRRHIAVGRHHDGLSIGLQLARQLQYPHARVAAVAVDALLARALGHAQVGHDDIERTVTQLVGRVLDPVDDGADMPGSAQGLGHHIRVLGLVLDDQDLGDDLFSWLFFAH